jgi:hypothetical protein
MFVALSLSLLLQQSILQCRAAILSHGTSLAALSRTVALSGLSGKPSVIVFGHSRPWNYLQL